MSKKPLQMSTQIPSVKLVLLSNNIWNCVTIREILKFKENLFIGESSVGKSSTVTRYATDTFIEGRDAAIGGNFHYSHWQHI
jgi:Ras-related protein Rab-5C